ncbi:MAG TPA: helix-turn-helix domain-containing protein [Thermohalobaculum sp.]|nr:helix-turn-helix domain-containing protein [Thermohalobaculum sp.]
MSDLLSHHLNQIELSRRWRISPRTLERWRWLGEGPQYLKIGGRVVYRLSDIESYEAALIRGAGHEPHRPMSA